MTIDMNAVRVAPADDGHGGLHTSARTASSPHDLKAVTMHTYVAFGNPMNYYETTAFVAEGVNVTMADGLAHLSVGPYDIDGVIIHRSTSATDRFPAHLSILVSEDEPGEVLTNAFLAAGFTPTDTVPHGATVPFSVEAILVVGDSTEDPVYFTTMWADAGYAPLQRTTLRAPAARPVNVTVLAVNSGGRRPQIIVHTDTALSDDPWASLDGWSGPVPGLRNPDWNRRIVLARALTANVGHLLGRPIVLDVTVTDVHALDAVTAADIALLDEDTRIEAKEPLAAAGREDLAEAC